MSADVIVVDFKKKTRLGEMTLEQQAVYIVNGLIGEGIDGMMYESTMGWFDPPFVAPDKDPA